MSVELDAPGNSNLQACLRTIEATFLNAVLEGPESLVEFSHRWSSLQKQIATKRKTACLDLKTASLARDVAASLSIMGKHLLEIEDVSSSLASQLMAEAKTVLESRDQSLTHDTSFCPPTSSPFQAGRTSKPSLQSIRHSTTTRVPSSLATVIPSRYPSSTASITGSPRSTSDPNPLPEFIEHAYKFFVANIFNPYPTREEKKAIVDQTNSSRVTVASISNWFTNARRRCGWAEILKRRCDGNRDEMVDLATRVFIEPDPNQPVDPQIVKEMMEMKANLESMYERKLRTSAWMNEIKGMEELINPIPKEDQVAAKKRETDAERQLRRRQKEMLKEQQDFERRERKIQTEALRKAEKVAKAQREQEKQAKEDKNKESNEPLYTVLYPPAEVGEGSGSEPSRSSSTPHPTPPSLSPGLDITASFDYTFTCEPPTGVADSGVAPFDPFFDLSVNASESSVATPPRGQKRPHDLEEGEPTPKGKRPKAIVTSSGPDLVPVLWSASQNPAINLPCTSGTEDSPSEYEQLFQLLMEPQSQPPILPTFETSEHTEQRLDAQLAVPSFNLQTPGFILQQPTPSANPLFHHEGGHNLDFGGFMSGCMSDEALNDLGMTFPDATHPAAPDLSRPTWASPAWTSNPATPSETSPTPAELAEKAMNKERKRKELENKKVELERERARLAELERELDDD